MALATSFVLLVAGGALLAAFLADVVARKVGLPDVLLLLAVGIFVGPVVLHGDVQPILGVAPYVGTAALALILFDAGMELRLRELGKVPAQATVLAVFAVGLSMLLVFPLAFLYLTGGNVLLSLIFAGALSCTSSAVVVPVASRMSLPSSARSLVHISSAVEDTMAIIIVTSLMLIALPSATGVPIYVSLLLPLPLAILGGLGAGLFWIEMVRRYQTRPFFSMATVGFLFGVVGGIQALGGAGVLSALILGVMLGNAQVIRDKLRWKGDVTLIPQVRGFQTELAYLLRAFFMLLLGMLLVVGSTYEDLFILGGVIAAVLIVARATAVETFLHATDVPRAWNFPLVSLSSRGLTSAVLVVLPVTAGLVSQQVFLDPTLIVVIATVIITSAGVLIYENVPSVHEGKFGEKAPLRPPLSDEERRDLISKEASSVRPEVPPPPYAVSPPGWGTPPPPPPPFDPTLPPPPPLPSRRPPT